MNTNITHLSMCEHSEVKLMTHRSHIRMIWTRAQVCFMNPGRGRQRGIGGEKGRKMKGMRSKVICCWLNIKHYSWACSCAWTEHEESCLQAHLLTHHTYSTQYQYFRWEDCTVNTVPHTLRLITVELIVASTSYMYLCTLTHTHTHTNTHTHTHTTHTPHTHTHHTQSRGGHIFHQKTEKLI